MIAKQGPTTHTHTHTHTQWEWSQSMAAWGRELEHRQKRHTPKIKSTFKVKQQAFSLSQWNDCKY